MGSQQRHTAGALTGSDTGVSQGLGACTGTTTIGSSEEASALASCTTYSGTVAIATDAAKNVALDGLEVINGNLTADNATELYNLSGNALRYVDNFYLRELTALSSMDFPLLTSVDVIEWSALPSLGNLSFSTPISRATSVNIQDTFLSSFEGLGLSNLKSVGTLYIGNNKYMENITIPNLDTVDTSISFESNGFNANKVFLPVLATAADLTFRNATSVSIPSLTNITGDLFVTGAEGVTFSAGSLEEIGSTLTMVNSESLSNLSFPALATVGGSMNISHNPNLTSLAFASLQTIGGDVDLDGNFTSVTFPSLRTLRGALNLTTTATAFDCAALKRAADNGTVEGGLACTDASGDTVSAAAVTNPDTSSSSTDSSSSSSTSSSSSIGPLTSGAKIGLGVGIVGGVFGIACGAALVVLLRRLRRQRRIAAASSPSADREGGGEEGGGGGDEKRREGELQELPESAAVQELEAHRLMNELDAERGFVEAPGGGGVVAELPGDDVFRGEERKGKGGR
ncbi:cell wall protein Ecm33 [Diplodia intermedia]|uniref:Cell wall protein Ecm33 n=1 Tax=Diplodia intermedia TaxID=856260 RepID=A0ABR3T4P1_9PEZI